MYFDIFAWNKVKQVCFHQIFSETFIWQYAWSNPRLRKMSEGFSTCIWPLNPFSVECVLKYFLNIHCERLKKEWRAPFYTPENWGSEKLSNLSNVIQQESKMNHDLKPGLSNSKTTLLATGQLFSTLPQFSETVKAAETGLFTKLWQFWMEQPPKQNQRKPDGIKPSTWVWGQQSRLCWEKVKKKSKRTLGQFSPTVENC